MGDDKITLTNAQLQQLLQGAGQFGMNRMTGPSFVDQFRNGSAQMRTLKGLNIGTDITQQQFDASKSAIKSNQGSAIAGGAIAGLQGGLDLLNNAFNMAQNADTSGLQNQVDAISEIGNTQYNSFEQLSSDYDRLAASPMNFNYKDIRGKTDGELVGGVLTSTLSGAATGLTIGGPWGALAGAVVGLGSGIGGVLVGNRNAQDTKERLELEAYQNTNNAQRNLSQANEDMMQYNFRAGVSRRAAMGGKIERDLSIEGFKARAMKKPRRLESPRTFGIVRRHGEGGTVIRIKR